MAANLNSVKTGARTYHHGDLRSALVDAGREIIEDRGLEGFSLRAAARRAGVSPAAPAHHFRDARGLLTAIATRGFVEFGDAIEAATGPDRRSTIVRRCHAYLDFALTKPGLFRLMWRKTALDMNDPDHLAAAHRVFDMTDRTIRGDDATYTRPDDPKLAPTIACWSMVHGFTMLVLDGASFGDVCNDPERLKTMLDDLLAQLG
ncbi:MAG: TetR/AcrR family transcriptional regulator [Alphaproteobacteria bacterium]|nr:MAG: TetR/AcrR family transcriptional regulator [Alphaproteobacteria bacterium]